MRIYAALISFFRRKILRKNRDRWNYQYDQGRWQNLHQENDRFDAVIRLLQARQQPLSILEIGCGDAILFRKLPAGIYSRFTGVDISDVAVAAAKAYEAPQVHFVAADMNDYRPAGQYGVIIFNESLYYARDTRKVLKRFEPALLPGGLFIITAVRNKYTAGFWGPLESAYRTVSTATVTAGDLVWDVKELAPQTVTAAVPER